MLIAYFLVSYSVGLVALAVAFASWLRQRTRVSGLFFGVTLLFAIIAVSSLVMNISSLAEGSAAFITLRMINYTAAIGFILFLPYLVHTAYGTPHARSLNIAFLLLAFAAVAAGVVCWASGKPESGGMLVLALKDISVLYALVRMAAYSRLRSEGEIHMVLHYVMVGTAVIYPAIVVSELAPSFFYSLVPVRFHGSISLPLALFVWSVSYLLSWFRMYTRPAAFSDSSVESFRASRGLSPRESEVVRLLISGRSYKEIMAELSISMPTVKTHISSVYRKTGCNNKMQLSLLIRSEFHTKV